ALMVATFIVVVVVLARDWHGVIELLNDAWPPWVNNVANVFQIVTPVAALMWWLTRAARSATTVRGDGAWPGVLRRLARLLPRRHRERFTGKALANPADG